MLPCKCRIVTVFVKLPYSVISAKGNFAVKFGGFLRFAYGCGRNDIRGGLRSVEITTGDNGEQNEKCR